MSHGYLGVSRSLTGRAWVGPTEDERRHAAAMAQATGLPEVVSLVLTRAGVAAEETESYLSPKLRDLMPDPSHLRDMDRAADLMSDHLDRGSRIAVFADYDVDGAASAALLHDWLAGLGTSPTIYVPDRIDEGYGPNEAAMEALAADHPLIICVDCGTLSHAPIARAGACGADVIVLDHHLGGEVLPPAGAVVNPNRQDETTELTYLCAAGVVFLFLVAMNRVRRERGQACPELMELLDLVSLATVADVAPLVGLNRALVRQGLTAMARRRRPGLAALADVARMTSAPAPYHLGFLLGPRINAGGRVGEAMLGTKLLTAPDTAAATPLAVRLDALNTERREIEAEVLAAAVAQAEARGVEGALVWAAGDGWHPGVVGIVASRLKEAYGRPAVVIGLAGGEGKGSGRSVAGIDLGASIAVCVAEELLLKGGGHKMAAGLTVAEDLLEPAMARLDTLLARQGAGLGGPRDLSLAGMLAPAAATEALVTQLADAGPFGAGAPEPRFVLADCILRYTKRVGETHLSLTATGPGGGSLQGIAFRAFESDLGPALLAHDGRRVHLAGRLEIDDWGGRRRVKLRLEDAAFAGE